MIAAANTDAKLAIDQLLRVTQSQRCRPVIREEFFTFPWCAHVHKDHGWKRGVRFADMPQVDHLLTAEGSAKMSQEDQQRWVGRYYVTKRRSRKVPATHGITNRQGTQVFVDRGHCAAHAID